MLYVERVRWDQLQRLLCEIPVDRFDEPTLNPDGWSVRDLVWHLARWNEVIAEQLELMNMGTFDEGFDWNTEENNGVLVYVLLADHAVEIVADRGIDARLDGSDWRAICREMEARFAEGRFEEGAIAGIRAIAGAMGRHFPGAGPRRNELPDRPMVL